jgi:hypothetical protein
MVFLALAITTAVFMKVGHRFLKIGLLTAATGVLIIVTMAAIPFSFGLLTITLIAIASVAFIISPVLLQSRLNDPEPSYIPMDSVEEGTTHWSPNER